MDIHQLMAELSVKRSIFHSEADFQHELAFLIHKQHPDLDLRLEYPIFDEQTKKRMHIDILLRGEKQAIAIELKYATTKLSLDVEDEHFDLRDQSADDSTRYAFCKDIERIEHFKSQVGATGYAVFLTNYPPFWSPSSSGRITTYDEFRIHDGLTKHGEMRWASHAGKGTIKGVEEPIILNGTYSLTWQDYAQVNSDKRGLFRYLAAQI